jgi:TPR repeat protein
MLRSLTKRGWRDHIASLVRQADAGEVSAMTDLGLNLFEGIQDRRGRSIVRRNPRAAVAWFRQAANRGDSTAASSLGYAYNVGLGTKRNVAQAIRWYRRAARSGNSTATYNLATVYRDAGKPVLAFQW